ncbi:MAG: hypothetical protein IPI60_04685 [Saprospiraceae bacterium]|nr:hypothetical protein [Saprospiraceae bacterium]
MMTGRQQLPIRLKKVQDISWKKLKATKLVQANSLPEVFSIEQSLTIGANVNFASGQTNTSNQNQAVNSSIEDRIKIPNRSVLYFFTEWEEEKAKTTIAYDGKTGHIQLLRQLNG